MWVAIFSKIWLSEVECYRNYFLQKNCNGEGTTVYFIQQVCKKVFVPVLHHRYFRLQYKETELLQATIYVIEDWEPGQTGYAS